MKIYHNNRCGKSRETLEILKVKGQDVEVIEYLKETLSVEELRDIIKKLKIKPEQLIRKGEKVFKEKFEGKKFTYEEWIQIMIDNPILIERPIVINGDKAVIGRPPESVLTIL